MDLNIKRCIANTKNGLLRDAYNILNARSIVLTSEDALKIIISLCNAALNEKSIVHFTPNDLLDLLFICTPKIENLDDNSMNSFLASIYYIIKYFLDMDYYKFVNRLEHNFISIISNNVRDSKLKTLCANISKVIYNKIVVKHTSMKSSDLFILCVFSMKILYEIKEFNDILKEEVLIYFKNFNMIQLDLQSQRDIYIFIIASVEKEADEKTAPIYFQSTVNLLNLIIQAHFTLDGEFEKGKDMIFKTTEVFKKFKSLENMTKIMENIISIIGTEKNIPINMKTVLLSIQKSFHEMYQEKKSLQSMFYFTKFLHIILCAVKQNFRTFSNKFWTNFNVESQIILSKFIAHLCVSVSWIKSKCRTCENCESEYDLISAISISGTPAYILKYWLTSNNDNIDNKFKNKLDELLNQVRKSLDQCCIWMQELQKRKCNNWSNMWAEIGSIVYNFSLTLYRNRHIQAGFFIKYFIKKLILFEGIKDSVIKKNILNVALSSLSECYIHVKDNIRAMLIIALNICLHPQERESIFMQWVRIKSSAKVDTNLQNFNLVSLMVKYKNTLTDLYPNFTLSPEDEKDLLLFELRQYKKIWPSKLSLISAFNEICRYSDVLTTAKGIVVSWGDADNILPSEIYDVVFTIVSEFESIVQNKNTKENKIIMAFLYLVQYYVSCVKLQQQNKQDMNENNQTEATENPDIGDKHDECDVVLSYDSLKIDVHSQIMKYLKKSLNMFKKQINEDNVKELKEMNVYLAVVKIGNEFLVHSYSLEHIQAWLLCYRLGKILNDNICVIESIGNLMEVSSLDSDFIKSALFESKDIIAQVNHDEIYAEGENAVRKWIVLTNFFISLGLAHLDNGDVENALDTFQKSKEYYYKQSSMKKCDLLRVKLEFLEWRLQLLPCSYKVENHASALSKPFFLIEGISECYKTDGYNAYVIQLLFQIFCSLLHMYRWLRQPREVRCYGKQILFVAQQLVVPLKCVQILSYLVEADLMSVRIDDCRYKINSICEILGLSKDTISTTHSRDDNKKSVPCNDDVNSITNTLQEMMLDFPSTRSRYQEESSLGSPVLLRDSFKVPSFVEHDDMCECLPCSSVDYQNLVMVYVYLQAGICYAEENVQTAREYYEGALCVYKHLVSKHALFHKKVERVLDAEVMPTLENTFRETYCTILLGFGNTLMTSDKFLNISTNLIKELEKNPFLNYHLYNEAVFQKINYLSLKTYEAEKECRRKDVFLSPNNDHAEAPATPENKCSRVIIASPSSPVIEPAKRIVKVIKFDIPEGDDKEQKVVSKGLSPLQSLTKTPAVVSSKIKVYLPASAKATRKKKVAETLELPGAYGEKVDVVEPPKSSKKLEAKLKTRTKLLTEKLKNVPAVPNIVVTNETEQGCAIPGEYRTRTRIRRNLMSNIERNSENNENNFTSCASSSNSNSDISNKDTVKKRTRCNKIL